MPYGSPAQIIPGGPPNAVINGDCRVLQQAVIGVTSGRLINAPTDVFMDTIDMWPVVAAWSAGNFTPTMEGSVAVHPQFGAAGVCRAWQQNAVTVPPSGASWVGLCNKIEGQNLAYYLDRTDTELSFWAKSSKVGTHYVTIQGRGAAAIENQFVAPYTILTANTWTQAIIPVTLPTAMFPNAVAGNTGAVTAATIVFPVLAGATKLCTAAQLSTWIPSISSGGEFVAGPDFTNFNSGASFRVTDLMLSFRFAYKRFPRLPFGTQLAQCQRYFYSTFPYGTTPSNSSNAAGRIAYVAPVGGVAGQKFGVNIPFPVQMRATPTRTFWNPQSSSVNTWWNRSLSTDSGAASSGQGDGNSADRHFAQCAQLIGDLAGHEIQIHASFDANLT